MKAQSAALVASKHWRWLPGMALVPVKEWPAGHTRIDSRIIAVDPRTGMGPWGSTGYLEMSRWLPDLDDAATIGCLLSLVRDAHGAEVSCFCGKSPAMPAPRWTVSRWDSSGRISSGTTEAAALVAALLAAP